MQRSITAAVAMLLLLCAGALWLLYLDGDADAERELARAASEDTVADAKSGVDPAGQPQKPAGSADAPLDVARREAPDLEPADELGQWITGWVTKPLGSPPDESLAILAFADARDAIALPAPGEPQWWPAVQRVLGSAPQRAAVDAQGRFRLSLPRAARRALLFVDGRFLYLHRGVQVALPREEPLQLEAELGGCLRVRCIPPEAAPQGGEPLARLAIELRGYQSRSSLDFARMHRRTAITNDRGLGEFRALPPHYEYFLLGDPPHYAACRDIGIGIEPGELAERELRFALGAGYSGRVVDEEGAALAGARVWVAPPLRVMGFGPGTRRETRSDAEGNFQIAGARIGPVVVTAELDGYCPAQTGTLRGQAGGATAGIALVLERGLRIAGRVLLPDGEPATGARVAMAPRAPAGEVSWRDTVTDESGGFQFFGLEAGECELLAAVPLGVEGGADRELRARRAGIAAGSEAIELRLRPVATLTGRVRGDDAKAIPSFRLALWPEGRADEREEREFADNGGRFELEGLYDGSWRLEVRSAGWLSPLRGIAFDFPLESEELEVVLIRAARLAGVVLDPAGVPLAASTLELKDIGAGAQRSPITGGALAVAEVRSGSDGSFAIAELCSGVYELRADHERHAPSAKRVIELRAGQALEDLELRLTRGGVLTGEIFDSTGTPDAGRQIRAYSNLADDAATAVADAAGAFELGPLAAGPYSVSAEPTKAELERIQREGSDLLELSKIARRREAEVLDGESVHVVLGAPPTAALRVHGMVSAAGQPVDGGSVTIIPAGGGFADRRDAKVQGDGSYEVLVEQPGDVVVLYHRRIYRTPGLDFPTCIPPGAEYRFDIALPGGSIEGLVIGPDGAPAPGVSITLERESGLARPTFYGPARGCGTEADGTFRIADLEDGTFSLRFPGRALRPNAPHGATVRSGVVVRGAQATRDIRIQLRAWGTLVGRVLDPAGEPVARAAIFVRDPAGAVLQTFTPFESDPTGRFRYAGLPEGEVLVGARSSTHASAVCGPVLIRAGEETEVELRAAPATHLCVYTENVRGEPLRARIRMLDAAGRDHAGLASIPAFTTGRARTSSASEHHLGPVAPGPYRLEAIAVGGERKVVDIEVGATIERELHLRIE